jgi:hypothetical protein
VPGSSLSLTRDYTAQAPTLVEGARNSAARYALFARALVALLWLLLATANLSPIASSFALTGVLNDVVTPETSYPLIAESRLEALSAMSASAFLAFSSTC